MGEFHAWSLLKRTGTGLRTRCRSVAGAMVAVALAALLLAWLRPMTADEAVRVGREFLDREYPGGRPWLPLRAHRLLAHPPVGGVTAEGGGWELWFESGTAAYNEAHVLVGARRRSVVAYGAARAPMHLSPAPNPARVVDEP